MGGLSLAAKSRFPETETAERQRLVRMWRLPHRKAEHLALTRPFGGQIGEASHSHSVREPPLDGGLDEIGREEGERDRHVDLAGRCILALRDAFDVGCRDRSISSLSQRRPRAIDATKVRAGLGTDRASVVAADPVRQKNFTAPR